MDEPKIDRVCSELRHEIIVEFLCQRLSPATNTQADLAYVCCLATLLLPGIALHLAAQPLPRQDCFELGSVFPLTRSDQHELIAQARNGRADVDLTEECSELAFGSE
ncbi:MAG: hypothetical protein MUQ26_00455 [Armatimonadetes bacterium]|nr:hypothetical protein [Armatimonadota bacterium]